LFLKTSSAGVLLGKADYSPYGEPTDSALSRFGYAGEWTDETTGYSFLRARWLDVKTGSFLSEDPLVQMTQNAFGYAEGNPLSQIDPLGLWSWSEIGDGIDKWVNDADNLKMLSDISDVSGMISTGLLAASFIPTPLSPILAGMSGTLGLVSIVSGGIETLASCNNDLGKGQGITDDCIGGAITTAVSVMPLTKTAKYVDLYARRSIPRHLSVVETGRVRQLRTNARFGVSGIESSGYFADFIIKSTMGEEVKC
jgi:RHS repeat-associated protein